MVCLVVLAWLLYKRAISIAAAEMAAVGRRGSLAEDTNACKLRRSAMNEPHRLFVYDCGFDATGSDEQFARQVHSTELCLSTVDSTAWLLNTASVDVRCMVVCRHKFAVA